MREGSTRSSPAAGNLLTLTSQGHFSHVTTAPEGGGVEGSKEFKEIKADFFFSPNFGKSVNVHSESQDPDQSDAEPHTEACQSRTVKAEGTKGGREREPG